MAESKKIKALECKHATYTKANDGSGDDLITVKEVIHYEDGTTEPNVRILKNYPRTFYITKKGFQNHTDKKEWESKDRLQKFLTTQSGLLRDVARALGRPGAKGGLKTLGRSPYLYGTDQTPTCIIKGKYRKKYPDTFIPNTVAVLDIETDVIEGHGRPIYSCLSFKDRVYLGVTKEFIGTAPNFLEKLTKKAHELLGEYITSRNIKLEIEICDNAGVMCANTIAKGHEWKPDFITIWNIDFDIPQIVTTLQKYNFDLADVFSDPKVPKRFRYFSYRQGKTKKTTASGDVNTVPFAERWHKAECPASFFLIDSMCVYRRIRLASQQEPSYSLDAQLNKHLGLRKLKFEEAAHIPSGSIEWHQYLQANYKVEYGVYNIFDCIGVELLDEKLRDLSLSITVLSGISDYTYFDSQPRRLVDQLVDFCDERDLIIASAADRMVEALDDKVVSMNGWVITLPTHLTIDNGLKVVKDMPDLRTLIRSHTADLDISASYPSTQLFLNVSKETTYREVSKVEGVDEQTKRFAGINLTCVKANSVEIAQDLFKAPKLDTLLEHFNKTL